tara:strand:- start:198 stop:557 length:360 start_codon:yes stop_codon:yes gene_type:complete
VNKDLLQRRYYQEGDQIFLEGDQGKTAYVVQSGEVEIYTFKEGIEEVLGKFSKDEIFGEMGLIIDEPRMASARCTKSASIIIISQGAFEDRLASIDPFVRGLIKLMIHHIRKNMKESFS